MYQCFIDVVFPILILCDFPGCGDCSVGSVSVLPDPCPLPDKLKKRSLNEKEKLIYAPLTGVGGVVYDKVSICMCVLPFT